MPNTRYAWPIEDLEPLHVMVTGWAPEFAEREYLARLEELLPRPAGWVNPLSNFGDDENDRMPWQQD